MKQEIEASSWNWKGPQRIQALYTAPPLETFEYKVQLLAAQIDFILLKWGVLQWRRTFNLFIGFCVAECDFSRFIIVSMWYCEIEAFSYLFIHSK